jgi:hypothetical protein
MKGSKHSIYLVLCGAAALAGMGACSHRTPEPSSPSLDANPGRSTSQDQSPTSTGGSNMAQPGFDSDRDSQGAGQQSGSQQGSSGSQQGSSGSQQGSSGSQQGSSMQGGSQSGQPGSIQGGSTGSDQQGAQQQGAGAGAGQLGSQGSQGGSPGTTGSAGESGSSLNEREACDLLTSEAMLRMEPIEGGVAIVAKPRRSIDMSTVRSRVQMIHRGIERSSGGSPTTQCDLFALGRNGTASVIETPDSIRLLVTTTDAARVPQLRRQANEFMRSKGAPGSHGGSQGGGSQGGGSQGGGSQGGSQGGGSQPGGSQGGGTQPGGSQGGGTQPGGSQGGGTQPGGTP